MNTPATPIPSRLQSRLDRITEAGFAVYESHARAGTRNAVPHWIAALPAFAEVNANSHGEPLLDYLIERLKNRADSKWVIETLGAIGEYAAPAVSILIERLRDETEDEGVRSYAAETLGRIGEQASAAVPALIECLKDEHWDVPHRASIALRQIGQSIPDAVVPALIELLKDENKDWKVRHIAVDALGDIGEYAAPAIPALIDCEFWWDDYEYKDEDSFEHAYVYPMYYEDVYEYKDEYGFEHVYEYPGDHAAEALGKIGQSVPDEVVPALIERLKDENWDVRHRMLIALGKIGAKASAAVPVLIECLRDENWGEPVRYGVAIALGKIGTKASAAVPVLIERLKDRNVNVRYDKRDELISEYTSDYAVEALAKIGQSVPDEVVPTLIERLKDENKWVGGNAARVLGRIGKLASAAVSALIECLKDKSADKWVRENAASALGGIGEQASEAVPALIERLRDKREDTRVRISAASALGGIGEQASEAVPALIERLRDENERVPENAVWALGKIGQAVPNAVVPNLIKCLRDMHWDVRRATAWVLVGIGEQASEAVPALIERLRDKREDTGVRISAASALGRIGEQASEAVPVLIECLRDENERVPENAVWVLQQIGERASAAVPALIERFTNKHANGNARRAAAEALGSIGKQASEAVPALIECLKDKSEDKWVRENAASALGKIGQSVPSAVVPALIECIRDKSEDKWVRSHVGGALRKLQQETHLRIVTSPSMPDKIEASAILRAHELAWGYTPFPIEFPAAFLPDTVEALTDQWSNEEAEALLRALQRRLGQIP